MVLVGTGYEQNVFGHYVIVKFCYLQATLQMI